MPGNHERKITAAHIERDALLYVRQSSLRQVLENTESTKRQYALRERAVALGWPMERIHTIDNDLGVSGAQAAGRDGFTHLVSEVAMGHVGIVLGLEVSRLARNNADWHRLLELSGLSNTLILDEDGIYDPTDFNDRLLLGLKGAMSEAELHVLKARLQGGIRNKARRGELEVPLPIGFVYRADKSIALDPDESIVRSLQCLFDTFRSSGSAMAVVRRFEAEQLLFPRRIRRGIGKGDLLWGRLNHSRVLQILHNPRYAGAFVYGRTRTQRTASLKSKVIKVPQDDWQVLIKNAHIGYIDWDEFERNQTTLRNNAGSFAQGRRGTLPREGAALLQGRVVCGYCGARMRVRYQQLGQSLAPYYQCTEDSVRHAGKLCQSVRGTAIDEAIKSLLLKTVAPAALESAIAVQDEIANRVEEAESLRLTTLERARYEAELARRRYLKVDPDNRLVADAIEAEWNTRLRELDELQQAHDRHHDADQMLLSDEMRKTIRQLATDFPRVWSDPRTPPLERKRLAALLIEDVTLVTGDEIAVHVRWSGGQTTSLSVERPKPMSLVRKTRPEVVAALDELLETYTDREAAQRLNELGHRNWKQEPFTVKKVAHVRCTYQLKSRYQRLVARGLLTARELAEQLQVSTTAIHTWGRQGILQRELYGNAKRCLYAPLRGMLVEKGHGGRHPKPAILTNAQTSAQETV